MKSLHLLLDAIDRDELCEYGDLVPSIEVLLTALSGSPLPIRTQLLLMREYERRRQYAQASEAFKGAFERAPQDLMLLDLGISFFERVNGENDATLVAGGLPRSILEGALAELVAKKSALGESVSTQHAQFASGQGCANSVI